MIHSAVIQGLVPLLVEVEIGTQSTSRAPFQIVGLGRTEVKESHQRIQNAFANSGFEWPVGKISVNLAPADAKKGGTSLDLAIALGLLEVNGQIRRKLPNEFVYAIGELSFEGNVRAIRGAIQIARNLPHGAAMIAPRANEHELALLRQIKDAKKDYAPYVVETLREAADVIAGTNRRLAGTAHGNLKPAFRKGTDFKEIKGQQRAKHALEIAAAGGHNVLLVGPPGEGKSMLAKAFPSILPPLSPKEIVELTAIYSAAGHLPENNTIVSVRPFRKVHHTASPQSLVGGGTGFPRPGEVTLAHHGVLFLDELLEFKASHLDALRQPLEDGEISLQRTGGTADYPAEVILVAAMNPCKCGFEDEFVCSDRKCGQRWRLEEPRCVGCGSTKRQTLCKCSEAEKKKYKAGLSGPLEDRIDLKIRIDALTTKERNSGGSPETSKTIRKRIETARALQAQRFEGKEFCVNARIPGGSVDSYCVCHPSGEAALKQALDRMPELSTRGYDKLLKVSRTVADLNNSRLIYKKHIAKAAELSGRHDVHEFLMQQDDTLCPECSEPIQTRGRFCPQCGHALRSAT